MLRYADVLTDPLRYRYGQVPAQPVESRSPDVSGLRTRCTQVGDQLGWRLNLSVWQQLGVMVLTARAHGTDEIPLTGPDPITEDAITAIGRIIDALARGERRLVIDGQGEPRLL